MAGELGTLGAENHNPSSSDCVCAWVGGIMSAQAGPSGHLGFSLLDFLPEVITASHRGIFPLTRFEYDEVPANIIYHAISAVTQSPTAWQSWTKQPCGSSGYEFSHSDIRELKDICATSVWLINYLNGVDGQGLTYGPTVMGEEPKWHVAQERRSHMRWLKETSGTARELRVTQSTAN